MNKKTGIIIGVLVAVFLVLVGISLLQKSEAPSYRLSDVKDTYAAIDYNDYNFTSVIPASENSGNLPENILGDKDAPVKIYEYGDYQCTGCAPMNPYVNKIVEDYDGKVAVVFRTYILDYHNNGVAAAAAANAAAIQGYWKEYKDLLFSNQADWYYSGATTLQRQFENYFEQATDGKGDLEKFRQDMQSKEVLQKIAFDMGIGNEIELAWTPYFFVEDSFIDIMKEDGTSYKFPEIDQMIRDEIDKKLKALETK